MRWLIKVYNWLKDLCTHNHLKSFFVYPISQNYLWDTIHFIDPWPLTFWICAVDGGFIERVTAVQELDGVLHHSNGPLGNVVGQVGEVSKGEGKELVKDFLGNLLEKSGTGCKIGHGFTLLCDLSWTVFILLLLSEIW